MLLSGYLSVVEWAGARPVACGAGSSCDVVQSSRYAVLLGFPVAAWGLGAYLALATVALTVRRAATHWFLSLLVSGTGLAVSLYLTAVSFWVIEAACVWCLASLAVMAACFGVALVQRPDALPAPSARRAFAGVALAAVLLPGGLHLYYQHGAGAAPETGDPRLRALADHLSETGARFYGAAWCPHCNDQKEIFGAAAERLPYVECAPDGPRGPQASACRAAGVNSYPTWIIGGERYEGLLPPRVLARLSGFPWSESRSR